MNTFNNVNTRGRMPNVTVAVPDDLKEQMTRHEEVNWSAVIRRAVQDHLRKLALVDAIDHNSTLGRTDADDLDRLIKKGLAGTQPTALGEERKPKGRLWTLLSKRRKEILAVARKYGASEVRVFGSVARGQADRRSDLDLLVRFEPGRSLLDQIALQQDLEELLGLKVDVVSVGGLSPYIRENVLREAVPV